MMFIPLDLYKNGGFDGNPSYFFVILAEDLELKDSNGYEFS